MLDEVQDKGFDSIKLENDKSNIVVYIYCRLSENPYSNLKLKSGIPIKINISP